VKRRHTRKGTLLAAFMLLFCFPVLLSGQPSSAENQIEIVQADALKIDKNIGIDARRLIGNVILKHKDALMYCDSAYFYSTKNSLEAFGQVHINQGDTVSLFADFVRYNGETSFAQARYNVRLIDDDMTLYTDSLDYFTNTSNGEYLNGGRIENEETVLESKLGRYMGGQKMFFFKDSVTVVDPEYLLFTDTLKYNTESEIVYYLGPTTILSDSNEIYCEYGWYNSQTELAEFTKNAYIKDSSRIIRGQRLFYDNRNEVGEAEDRIEIEDFENEVIVQGEEADFDKANEIFTITKKALLIYVNEGDSVFLHGDTLHTRPDTSGEFRIFKAYRKVKFYKEGLQGKCDSLVYSSQDSIVRFYHEPVLWMGDNQITARYIEVHVKNKALDVILMDDISFIASKVDTVMYNQIRGKNMIGHFRDNKIYRIDVKSNAQSIYFPMEDEEVIGLNRVESSTLSLFIEKNRLKNIVFRTKPSATLIPLRDLSREEYYLDGFAWYGEYRPMYWKDVFTWKK
jgi:lipopolysaccharide export system protein LptA